MCDKDKALLRKIANQLHQWAIESKNGGWSTHQVDPMMKLKSEILDHIFTS